MATYRVIEFANKGHAAIGQEIETWQYPALKYNSGTLGAVATITLQKETNYVLIECDAILYFDIGIPTPNTGDLGAMTRVPANTAVSPAIARGDVRQIAIWDGSS